MCLEIRKLSVEDGWDIYEMLQEMPADENGFMNSVAGMSFDEFREWLKKADISSKQTGIIDGWKVPQTTFWLFENGKPIGCGKVRHFLTDALLESGGNVGYSIRPSARNKGFGKKFLALLIEESRKIGVDRILLTIRKNNEFSMKVALANGGKVDKETDEKYYIWIDL